MKKYNFKDLDGLEYTYFSEYNYIMPQELIDKKTNTYRAFKELCSKFDSSDIVSKTLPDITKEVSRNNSIILEVSQDCNLRCRYCVFSDHFPDRRKHEPINMNWETAKAAIDYFFDVTWEQIGRKEMQTGYNIGFYGGEPLLNFDLIKKTVNYSQKYFLSHKSNKSHPNVTLLYNITTNGTLLTEENINYLVNNDFSLLISLDGPKQIHEKNKGGNHDHIMNKLNYIKQAYPNYYRKNIDISIVYAKDTDLKAVRNFFNQSLFDDCDLSFSYVKNLYSSFSMPDYGINEREYFKEVLEKKRQGISLTRVDKMILSNFLKINLKSITHKSMAGGYCTLGTKKLFVTADGYFKGCEQIHDSYTIGDIHSGYDYNKIYEIEKKWKEATRKCKDCKAWTQCSVCMAKVGVNGEIDLSEYCKVILKDFDERMGMYIKSMENCKNV